MNRGRHVSGRSRTPVWWITGAFSVMTGLVLLPLAVVALFRYSPYEDPGAGRAGLWLGVIALAALGAPAAVLACKGAGALARTYMAWKRSLTPHQQALLTWGEAGAMLGTHLLWRHHNRQRDAELTASVMGSDGQRSPGGEWTPAA